MANSRNGNTFYVDTQSTTSTDDLVVNNILLLGVALTASAAASGSIVLSDVNGSNTTLKLELRVAAENGNTSGASRFFDFSNCPLLFPNGIKVSTLASNTKATLIIRTQGG